tara:strand:+ start:5436 stop:5540 length:105 start_codon:yes stop_codon:yes gene_type:complete
MNIKFNFKLKKVSFEAFFLRTFEGIKFGYYEFFK